MPACDASGAPMRDTATMVSETGSTVQNTALMSDSHITGAGCASSASGRPSTTYWITQQAVDTHIAYATSRSEPMRRTSSPLRIR
ncbi:hypothetical protein D3C72_2091930 [compost metagenome]